MINYFELYGIPMNFNPDTAQVKSKFYELSRKYHPDRFAQADDAARAEALRMAALNNDAYKVLSNPDATMSYILKQNNLLQDEEKYNLPPEFLMEMMDLNEAISDYEMSNADDQALKNIRQLLQQQLDEWNETVKPLTDKFNNGDHSDDLLLRIKDYYFRKKYLLRIQERINTFAAH